MIGLYRVRICCFTIVVKLQLHKAPNWRRLDFLQTSTKAHPRVDRLSSLSSGLIPNGTLLECEVKDASVVYAGTC